MELISFKNVSKTFYNLVQETKVLDDISFAIHDDEIVCLLGPSGCGKSTILNLINELIEPTKGNITRNAKLGYMFQKDCLMNWRNIYKNVTIGLEIKKDKSKESLEYVENLMKKYQIYEFKSFYPSELSGGLRQRVSLIRTLVLQPDLLLLDEPFSKLDFQTRLMVQNDVYNIIKNEKKSALMVTHDIDEAIALSSRILVLSSRPTRIKEEIKIQFDSKLSPSERRKDPLFSYYYNQICKALEI
ncbi:MAG: ATP-binding cassette domain-containing protein [Bacilli bacterium]|nr:ATP-binding cassette domain-containing protein [Bacillales bacterium]MDY2575143.1 ATP-binding cassette domain-containing protein [Bacilli bacterium]